MKAIDMVKDFFRRFKKKENGQQKLLTSGKNPSGRAWREELVEKSKGIENLKFQRNDGSILTLIPIIQENGKQACDVIKNEFSGVINSIPVYTIMCEENGQGAQILGNKILLDMNLDRIRSLNPDELDFFSNVLLGKGRVEKIINQYEGYAGGMYRDQETRKTKKI